jgi:2-oxoglutarate ferredoxin oxidoreductase subunit beta
MRRLAYSIVEAFNRPGFSVIEVISPCAMYYSRTNKLGDGLDMMKFYYENSIIKHGEPTDHLDIDYQKEIIVGKFIDRERPTFTESLKDWQKG